MGTPAARLRLEVFLCTVFSHLWMKAANNEPLIILMPKFSLFKSGICIKDNGKNALHHDTLQASILPVNGCT